MMAPTGNAAFDLALINAEGTLQAAVNAAGVSQATATAAAVTYYRTLLAAAVTNNIDAGVFQTALESLGTTV